MLKRNVTLFLKFFFSFGLLGWFFWKSDGLQVLKVLSSIPVPTVLAAIFMSFFAYFINAVKWQRLLNTYKLKPLFFLTLIAQYYTLILPGQIAGEIVKICKLAKGKQEAEQIAVSVIIDRMIGLIALMLVSLFGLSRSRSVPANDPAFWFGTATLVFIAGLYLLYFDVSERIIKNILFFLTKICRGTGSFAEQIIGAVHAWKQYLKKPLVLLTVVVYSMGYQFVCVWIILTLALGFDIRIPFADWCWIFGIISAALILPVTVGGLGLREGGFVFLLGNMGIPGEKAMAVSLSLFGIQIICALTGGILDLKTDFREIKTSDC